MIKSQLLDGFEDFLKWGLTGLRNVTKMPKFVIRNSWSKKLFRTFPNLRGARLARFLQNLKPVSVEFRNNIH